MVAGPIGQNGWVDDFTTGTALPGVESTHKIIVLLRIHAAFALWTSHCSTSSFHELYFWDGEKVLGGIT